MAAPNKLKLLGQLNKLNKFGKALRITAEEAKKLGKVGKGLQQGKRVQKGKKVSKVGKGSQRRERVRKGGKKNWKSIKRLDEDLLKKEGINAHALKKDFLGDKAPIARYDLYKHTDTGEILIFRQGGIGEPIFTGEFIK